MAGPLSAMMAAGGGSTFGNAGPSGASGGNVGNIDMSGPVINFGTGTATAGTPSLGSAVTQGINPMMIAVVGLAAIWMMNKRR